MSIQESESTVKSLRVAFAAIVIATAAIVCGLVSCGANAPAIKKADIACLGETYNSLLGKLRDAKATPVSLVELTIEEIACATFALGAKVPVAPHDAGTSD